MFRLLLFHGSCFTLHLMHCTIILLAHIWLVYPLGHVCAESELEEPTEQAQGEEFTNLIWIKASPGAFNHATCLLI
jgi:hypothetical protein